MIPSASFPSSSSSSSASATVHVEKATSEFLIGPDWTLNINICDTINSNPGLAKDVVKAVKKRLQHKNPKVQLLALTLLETMVKNCGDYVHFQIVERNILQEMIKIVKKKIDMHVRDKILVLLNSWQEAFGGPGGKHPQYYWAYEELRRSGVQFPRSSPEAASIFTPPVTHPPPRHAQPGYGMPSNSSQRLDEAMASEMENLSLSSINSMRDVLELLSDMLQAVNPNDRLAVKDEVIVDLVEQCRANQKRLMQMLTTTGDEELLGQGLELNDSLQSVLGKHDAIASGSPLPTQVTNFRPHSTEVHNSALKPTEVRESSPAPRAIPSAPVVAETRHQEEDDDDDFAQLARRHSKTQSTTTQNTYIGASDGGTSPNPSNGTSSSMSAGSTSPSNTLALALPDPPAPVKTTKEQDMIDFLSITLSTTATSPPRTPPTPTAPTSQGYPYASQTYPTNQGHVPSNSYVVPWAQPEPQSQSQPQPQPQLQPRPQNQSNPQFSSGYPPPPWAATPGYYSNPSSVTPYTYSTPRANAMASYTPLQGVRPLQHLNSFPARGINNGSSINGDPHVGPTPTGVAPAVGPKPFVPSYRLFEDLNVLGSADGRFKTSNASPPSLSGASGQSMVGGRK